MSADPLSFTVVGLPAPQGSKRHVGGGRMIESSAKVKPWREAVKYAALEEIGSIGLYFPSGPVVADIGFWFSRPKSHYRTGKNAACLRDNAPVYPVGKPDLDKLIRSTFDALTDAGVWGDDSQVVRIYAHKSYAPLPGAYIEVWQ